MQQSYEKTVSNVSINPHHSALHARSGSLNYPQHDILIILVVFESKLLTIYVHTLHTQAQAMIIDTQESEKKSQLHLWVVR